MADCCHEAPQPMLHELSGGSSGPSQISTADFRRQMSKASRVSMVLSDRTPHEIQGVPLRCLLTRLGRAFDRVSRSRQQPTRSCTSYHAFVSHDWMTSRWLKFMSLMLLYNAEAAGVSTFLVSLVGGLLIAAGVLPNSSFWMCVGFLNFFVFLFCWQQMRDVFLKPRLAFLDKLCIPQNDEMQKQECIRSLAGYMAASDTMVILWSTSYFDRVWCVYEVSAFLRQKPDLAGLHIMPVTLPVLILLQCALWLLYRMIIYIIWLRGNAENLPTSARFVSSISVTAVVFMLALPVQTRLGAQLVNNLGQLSRQVRHFDIRRAKCACCSLDHRHPTTGAEIACDRELVYETIAHWYGNDGAAEEEESLDLFNHQVREQLGTHFLQTWSSHATHVRLWIYATFSMNTPFLLRVLPGVAAEIKRQDLPPLEAAVLTVRHLLGWGSVFLAMLFQLWACLTVWGYAGRKSGLSAFVHTLLMLLAMLGNITVWAAAVVPIGMTEDDSLLPVIPFTALLVFVACLLAWVRMLPGTSPPRRDKATNVVPAAQLPAKEDSWDTFSI